jgi:hypothetical protein
MKQIDLDKDHKVSKFKTPFNSSLINDIESVADLEIKYFISPNRGPMFLLDRNSKMSENTLNLFNKIEPVFKEAFYQYYDYYNLDGIYIPRDNYVITQMQVGNAYDVHNDIREEDDGFSLILYVNDNFEGGELNFFHLNMEYKPISGDIVIFPHLLYHSVNDVKINNRYTIMISVEKFKDSNLMGWGK